MLLSKRWIRATWMKVERANQQHDLLKQKIKAYQERRPWRFEQEVEGNGAKYIWRIRFDEPVPLEWSLILSEVVHNLRSALDQSINLLTIDHLGTELKKSGFPVFTKRTEFLGVSRKHPKGNPKNVRSGLYQIRGIGPGPRTFVEMLQPYPQRGRSPLPTAIKGLHNFWNQDKHRLVHLVGLKMVGSKITTTGPPPWTIKPWIRPGILKDGTTAVRFLVDPPYPEMKVEGFGEATVAVKVPGGGGITLSEVVLDCSAAIGRLLYSIGSQNKPVPLDAIPENQRKPPWE